MSSTVATGWLTAVPFAVAAAGMVWWGRHDPHGRVRLARRCAVRGRYRRLPARCLGEQRSHVDVPAERGGVRRLHRSQHFWASSPLRHRCGRCHNARRIGSFRQSRRFVDPYLTGWIRESTGSFDLTLAALAVPLLLGGL
ncbi:MFS transporter [Pseudonocardia sp. MCCB 268]|nr:MFS transporter [Pseudonocardia cytotoxica]